MSPTKIYKTLKPQIIETIPVLSKAKPKVWIEAYGCSASMADSEIVTALLKNAGYKIATKESEGGINFIVTCSVKDKTEHRMVSRITTMTKSGKPLIIAGCLPKADREKVESLNCSASLIGPNCIDKAPDAARLASAGAKLVALEESSIDKVNLPKVRMNPIISIIEIASGCMSHCSFCQTKIAKGSLRSYRIGDIVRQIKYDIESGCKEVWLSSTDNGCYGRDIGTNLVELLDACCSIEGSFKIRLGMMNPMYLPRILDDMVALFRRNDKIFKFLHIPVQSGSDRILKKMKRAHDAKTFNDGVQAFRERMPEITICTDIIVGFPSETDQDFRQTLDLVETSKPDVVNISRYSARPRTEAYGWKSIRIKSQVSKKRSESLHTLATTIARERNSLWKGWRGEIVVDEIDKVVQGRNYAYKPVVLSSTPSRRHQLGERLDVEVYDFSNFSLKAKLIF